MEKLQRENPWLPIGMLAAAIFTFFILPAENAAAQSMMNLSHLIPERNYITVMPDAPEGGDIVGYYGKQRAGLSEAEVDAFLNARNNWFRAIGKGGSPYTKPVALDDFAKILDADDEKLYRSIFLLIAEGKFNEAKRLTHELKDELLVGHVEAARLLADRARPSFGQMQDWLRKYNDLPEADDIYKKAAKLDDARKGDLTKPASSAYLSGSVERADGGGTMEWNAKRILSSAAGAFAKLLRKGKLEEAEAWLTAHKNESETGAKLALAEILMRQGKADKAWPLIHEVDISAAHFDQDSIAYALWLKGLIAWTQRAYLSSYQAFSALAEQKNLPGPNRAGAAFWAARAAEALGRKDDAQRFIAMAAKHPRSFYGVLALNRDNAASEYNWNLPEFGQGNAALFKKEAGARRALALLQLDERQLAETELRSMPLNGKISRSMLLALANRYGLPSLSVQAGSFARSNYDAALYPLMPWQPEGGYASDPALVLAVAKNESHFNSVARSPVGATGLMQIMPKTAEVVRRGSSANLYDPELNVTLGDRYLEMLTRTSGIGSNLLFIIGSYNCGPDRLLQLYEASKKQNGDDPLLFVETLPIKETRDYIQKVMATYWVYRARFNKPLAAMAELTVGRWPQYKPSDMRLTANSRADR
ncbi:MAG: lytic transglycosylase domain-containing protein [Proteobacteria bacterium]|nr:lytic transglycosylase domain-containing protein [Pseudomonadota bacterium]